MNNYTLIPPNKNWSSRINTRIKILFYNICTERNLRQSSQLHISRQHLASTYKPIGAKIGGQPNASQQVLDLNTPFNLHFKNLKQSLAKTILNVQIYDFSW